MSLPERVMVMSPDADAQICGAIVAAMVIKCQVAIVKKVVLHYSEGKPWLDNVVSLVQTKLKTIMFIDAERETAKVVWAEAWGIALMHGIGGMLCLPAVFAGVTATTASLGRWGAIWEVGWEITDVGDRLFQRCCLEKGAQLQPLGMLVFIFFHHALALCMVIPMNLYFPMSSAYFQLVCLLMFTAWIPGWIDSYSETLDVTQPAELRQMVAGSFVLFTGTLVTRLLVYWPILFTLLNTFKEHNCMAMFYGLLAAGGVMMPLIGLVCTADAAKRLRKFSVMYWRGTGEGRVPLPGFEQL